MATIKKVFELHYVGKRFSGARLPADVLQDIPAFNDLLISYAKDEWRRRNKDKKRLPNGFESNLALSLFEIKEGSAIPKLEWKYSTEANSLPGFQDEIAEVIEHAHTSVTDLIEGTNGRASALNKEKTAAIWRLGVHLQDKEKISIQKRSSKKSVTYNNKRREEILKKARETYVTKIVTTGELIGTSIPSGRKGFLRIRTREFGELVLPMDPERIYDEFSKRLNKFLRFTISAELDSADSLKSVVDVFETEVIEDETLARLAELRNLKRGWHNGKGVPVAEKVLETADQFFASQRWLTADFSIFPMDLGGILIEFEKMEWDYSIEFLSAEKFRIYGISLIDSEDLDPITFDSFDSLTKYIRGRLGGK